jgi:hypothetical protein
MDAGAAQRIAATLAERIADGPQYLDAPARTALLASVGLPADARWRSLADDDKAPLSCVAVELERTIAAAVCDRPRQQIIAVAAGTPALAGWAGSYAPWTLPPAAAAVADDEHDAYHSPLRALHRVLGGAQRSLFWARLVDPTAIYSGDLEDAGVVTAIFAEALGLTVVSEFGESRWRSGHTLPHHGALARTRAAADVWLATLSPRLRAVPGDACPRCGAKLVDTKPNDYGGGPGGDYDFCESGPVDLQCTGCAVTFASLTRRCYDFRDGTLSYIRG